MTNFVRAETPWEKARLGKFTSSEIDKLFTLPQGKDARKAGEISRSAKTYIESRAAEIVTGFFRQVTLWSMEWGNLNEPLAADRLGEYFPEVQYFGKKNPLFLPLTDCSGGSPDCLDLSLGIVSEIKCPINAGNHLKYCLLSHSDELKKFHRKHYHQIQMNMVCASKKYNIPFKDLRGLFCSYSPIVRQPYIDFFMLEVYPDMEVYEQLYIRIEKAEEMLAEVLWHMDSSNLQIRKAA